MLVRILVRLLLAARIGILAAVLACNMTSRSSACLDPDRAELVALTLQAVTNQAHVTGISIMSGYALVTYTDGVNAGGELLASKASGSWQTVLASGGQFGATDPLQAAGVSSSVAQYLIANIQPVPANNELTQPVAGSATYQSWTERCPTGE